MGGRDRAETSLFYVGLFGSLGAVLPLPWSWQMPQGIEWLLLLGMGLAGGIGHFLLIQAHRLAPASVLAPFIYTSLLTHSLMGFLIFADVPDRWTLAGASIVICAGLYLLHRERVTRR